MDSRKLVVINLWIIDIISQIYHIRDKINLSVHFIIGAKWN